MGNETSWLTCRPCRSVFLVAVVRSLVGNSDRVRCRKTDIGLVLECSVHVLNAHCLDTSLANGTTQRSYLTNCCRWIRLSVAVPSDKNDGWDRVHRNIQVAKDN